MDARNSMYTCPMHPQVHKNEPGRCPACGMELIPSVAKAMKGQLEQKAEGRAGHDIQNMSVRHSLAVPHRSSWRRVGEGGSHADHESAMTNPQLAKIMEADMRRRFWISLLFSIPIFFYSPVGENIFGLQLPVPIPVNWLLLLLTTPIV